VADAVRLLIADDHPVYREGLARLLAGFAQVEVVATAADGDEAIRLTAELQPDVVVMDLRMPGTDGIQATRAITGTSPHIGVLLLTMFDDDDLVYAAIRAGALGYLLKEADDDEVLRAVLSVAAGEAIFGPALARRILGHFADHAPAASAAPFPQLTAREREVLDLVAAGLANQDLAARLHISHRTARNHVSNIFAKLHVADRAQAIVAAREAGLGRQRNGEPAG
jgi:DNA-binding NarL/FixJ family response regulator